MKSANNSALFTDIYAEESSTLNGGRWVLKPIIQLKNVLNPFTGKFSIKQVLVWKWFWA